MQNMISNLELYFPFLAEGAINYSKQSEYELLVQFNTGDVFLYDDLEHSFRVLPRDKNVLTKDEFKKEFSMRLYKKMFRKGLTEAELAERTGLTQPQLSDYMSGKKIPGFYIIDKIARALECSTDEFRYI